MHPSRGRIGRQVNRSELARICGVSLPSIDQWTARGCPYLESPREGAKGWLFDTSVVIAWRERMAAQAVQSDTRRIDLNEANRRKTAAQAALAELELAEKRGEVVRVDDAARIAGEGYTRVRARLLAMPGRLAPLLAIADTAEECKDLVEGAVTEALAELAVGMDEDDSGDDRERSGGASPDAPGDEPGDALDAQAPAEAQGKRVGRRKARAQPRVERGAGTVEHRTR